MALFEKCLMRYDRIYVDEVFLAFQTQKSIDNFRSFDTGFDPMTGICIIVRFESTCVDSNKVTYFEP